MCFFFKKRVFLGGLVLFHSSWRQIRFFFLLIFSVWSVLMSLWTFECVEVMCAAKFWKKKKMQTSSFAWSIKTKSHRITSGINFLNSHICTSWLVIIARTLMASPQIKEHCMQLYFRWNDLIWALHWYGGCGALKLDFVSFWLVLRILIQFLFRKYN